jgi:hypothetical protein
MTVTTVSRGVGGGDEAATEKRNSAGTTVPQRAYERRSTEDLLQLSIYSNDLYQISL